MKLTTTIFALAITTAASAQANLKPLITQLDAASKAFKSATASVQSDVYTKVVRAHDLSTGTTYFERNGATTTMGAITYDVGPDGKPAKTPSKIVTFDGSTAHLYTPGLNEDDIFKAGASQAKTNTFLTLGFGSSGTDLINSWNVTDQGPETIDVVKTEKLNLVSKDPSITNTFTSVTIWIDPTRDVPLKQLFNTPNGDTRTVLYTNIKLNTHVDKKPYKIPDKANRVQR
jgi:outer membrane lipoprotein-sorting protein